MMVKWHFQVNSRERSNHRWKACKSGSDDIKLWGKGKLMACNAIQYCMKPIFRPFFIWSETWNDFQVSGLEHEIEVQKEDYERKLGELSSRLESIETGMKSAEEKEEEKNNNENTQMEELDKLKEEMGAKFADVCTKVFILYCQLSIWFLFLCNWFWPTFANRLSHCRKIWKTPMRQVGQNSERWTVSEKCWEPLKEMAFPEGLGNTAFILSWLLGGGELQPTADCPERHSAR